MQYLNQTVQNNFRNMLIHVNETVRTISPNLKSCLIIDIKLYERINRQAFTV